jgi:hypothetical protein
MGRQHERFVVFNKDTLQITTIARIIFTLYTGGYYI